ncbi:replication licensing factor Cdt1 [Massospora cicadina]|nr:replication licensing factor Cdt1 [Massospora cicadina]
MMSLTPKAQTLKALFATKKPTYEARSKRKLELASTTPASVRTTDGEALESKKGNSISETVEPSAPIISDVLKETALQPPTLIHSSPRVLTGLATSKPTLNVPGYLRYAALTCTGPLPLPEHYISIEKNFKYMFHTMLYQRVMWNTFTFHHLQPAIEKISKRSFPISQLGQFKELFPELFEFEPTKVTQGYQSVDSVFVKVPSLGLGCPSDDKQCANIYPIERIEELCKELHSKLVSLAHAHHNQFLLSRSLPTSTSLPSKWHPAFDLTAIPQVNSLPLFPVAVPEPPRASLAERAKLLLSRSTSDSVAKPMGVLERAKALLNKKSAQEAVASQKSIDERRAEVTRKKEELLNRIKAKEKQWLEFEAANPNLAEVMEMRLKLSQLQGVVRSLKAIFVTSQGSQPTKRLDYVVEQIATKNVWQLSNLEIEDRLKLLAEVIPSYVTVDYRPLSKAKFITLRNPSLSLNSIEAQIEAYKSAHGY